MGLAGLKRAVLQRRALQEARAQSEGADLQWKHEQAKPSLGIMLCTEGKPLRTERRWATAVTLDLKDKERTKGSGQRRQKENSEKTRAKASKRDQADVSVAKSVYCSSTGPEFWSQRPCQTAPGGPIASNT